MYRELSTTRSNAGNVECKSEERACDEVEPYVMMAARDFSGPMLSDFATDFTNCFWLLKSRVPTNDDVSTRKAMSALKVLIT